ncbi:MAG: sugar ABC transporter permease [Armatimonadetes bacterium]|jgi:N-acetylglucosamine transport system permease protein|nr:sugar ABC transporter permease [Armatimonadota bacterium]
MKRKEQKTFIAAFLLPPLLLYALFVLWPAVNAFRYSLTRWDGLGSATWVGLYNFRNILARSSEFMPALEHNVFLMVVPGIITLSLALFFAYVIHQRIRGARLFRIAFFFPNIISSVAVALLWVLIYSASDVGLLNNLLRLINPKHEMIAFAESSRLLWALVPMIVWSGTGFYMVLFLAAMENIPDSFYEAARLDGAGSFALFRKVTLPLMWDVLTTGIIFLVIGGLKIFDVIWVMENGRPTTTTHTMATLMYSKVFEEYNIGYGTAIAVLLFILVLLATMVSFRLLRRERLEY